MKSMNRRSFLAGAAAAAALPAIAPLAPVVPPLAINTLSPIVHVPNTLAASGNVFLTEEQVAAETLKILQAGFRMYGDLLAHNCPPARIADA